MDSEIPIQQTARGVSVALTVVPRSGRNAIESQGGAIKVHLKAAPLGGKANEELLACLSERLGISRSNLQIVSGRTSRRKVVLVSGLALADVAGRLLAAP